MLVNAVLVLLVLLAALAAWQPDRVTFWKLYRLPFVWALLRLRGVRVLAGLVAAAGAALLAWRLAP